MMEPIEWDEDTRVLATRAHVARTAKPCVYGRCAYGGTIEPGHLYIEMLALGWRRRMERDVFHAGCADDMFGDGMIWWEVRATEDRERRARERKRKLAKSNEQNHLGSSVS